MAKRTGHLLGSMLALGASGLLLGSVAACGDLDRPGEELPGKTIDPSQPVQPPVVVKPTSDQPPPISGGTLLISADGKTAVAADPDRDSVWLVDLTTETLRKRVRLDAGSEPGRVAEDQDGKFHVALRRGGQIAKIDPQTGSVTTRVACPAPRGLAYDAATDNLHVACAGGELVTMKARGGDSARTWFIDTDLRDVVVKGTHLLVTRFRTAEVIEVGETGLLLGRKAPPAVAGDGIFRDPMGKPMTSSATTAWRLLPTPDGQFLMLHQHGQDGTVSTKKGGYGSGSCKGAGIVSTGLTLFSGAVNASDVGYGAVGSMMGLTVDVAVSRDGQKYALISPTAPAMNIAGQVGVLSKADMTPGHGCRFASPLTGGSASTSSLQPTAGAFDAAGQLWVLSRSPAQLTVYPTSGTARTVALDGAEDRENEGHRLFHTTTTGMIACASCHAEAGDDSHVWTFDPIGPRRTQSLRGGILATAPFHWDGDMSDLNKLMTEVFTGRMSGPALSATQVEAVGKWLDAQPTLPKSTPRDAQAVARGQALFNDATVACASCHSGTHFTGNQTADVGTGKAFQIPSLIGVASRAPYMHAGCAATLRGRFDSACGGGDKHGKTSHLTSGQIDDLVAYLETL